MVLYINACVRRESRTDKLARELLTRIGKEYKEVKLADEDLKALSEERLAYRTALIAKGDYDDPIFGYAKEFAKAESIVISAPYWDLSFPALLKLYIENIYVTGIVSEYGPDGRPHGLCQAKRLFYVTTAGGPYDPRYSYECIRELCQGYFGIPDVRLLKAEMLDVEGSDAEKLLNDAKAEIKNILS